MKKILVVFTGGTIGSKTSGSEINVHENAGYELIDKYREQGGTKERIAFETVQPFTLLSENILPDDWERLYHTIQAKDPSQYDGIIITHGSDTLAYTAAAVSFMFHHTAIPIFLTACNYPLDDPRSEGVRNFAACVSLIVNDPLPGIFVIFEEADGRTTVHLGTRIMQSQPFTDRFFSIYDAPFGEVVGGQVQLSKRAARLNPSVNQLRQPGKQDGLPDIISFCPDILYLKPYPGFRYTYVALKDKKPQAILLELYHSGTAGIRFVSEEDSLEQFMTRCREEGIDLYMAPIKHASGNLYASSHAILTLGAIPLENISVEAALVKLMLAYGTYHTKTEIEQFLKRNLFYEFIF